MNYHIKEQWRFADYDGNMRIAEDEIAAASEATGEPEHVFAVCQGEGDDMRVVADCYSQSDADLVRDALNRGTL